MGKRKRRRKSSGPDLTSHLDLRKGDVLELSLGDHADEGNPVAEFEGAPVQVLGGLAGERVKCEVIWIDPGEVKARVVDVLEPSEYRRASPCQYFLDCTGCQWLHVDYGHQLELKRRRVEAAMSEYAELAGHEVEEVIGSPNELGYRNHARFTVARWPENRGQVGFMSAASRRFVRIDKCLLMNAPINNALDAVQDRLDGMSQFSVRASSTTGSMLIQPMLPSTVESPLSGQTHYEESVSGRSFRVASPSFFQVNVAQLEKIEELIKAMLDLDGRGTLLDAYSGAGTFAVLLSPYVRRVIAIEEASSGIADAMVNAAGIDNIEFLEGRSEDLMRTLTGTVDHVILDPPRVGCMPEAIDALESLAPRNVVLVSCDTTAMARDQARLVSRGFKLVSVQPVDMFPQTRHVEVLSLFTGTTGPER